LLDWVLWTYSITSALLPIVSRTRPSIKW
jgi:hypothetical protein